MADKIRVLHFIPGFLFGGIESLYLSWFCHLDRERVELELLLRTQDDDAEALKQYREMGGKYYRLAKMGPKNMFRYVRSVQIFFKLHHDYDILHAHGADPFVFYYAKKNSIKHIILHAHSTDRSKGEKFPLVKRLLHKSSLQYVTERFACSRVAGEWLFGKEAVQDGKVTVIHNAVDVEKFVFNSQIRREVRVTHGLKDCFVVGHVGRMTYPKNYPFLLKVFAELAKLKDNAILLLVGDGPEWSDIERQIMELGISDRVRLLGVRKDVSDLMQAMDVFLLPSHYEGLPVTLVEAQASGLYCLVADTVTDEVKLTEHIKFISLFQPPEYWAEQLLEIDNCYDRDDASIEVGANGFGVIEIVSWLQQCYSCIISVNLIKRHKAL